jgi:hypothetical protein
MHVKYMNSSIFVDCVSSLFQYLGNKYIYLQIWNSYHQKCEKKLTENSKQLKHLALLLTYIIYQSCRFLHKSQEVEVINHKLQNSLLNSEVQEF